MDRKAFIKGIWFGFAIFSSVMCVYDLNAKLNNSRKENKELKNEISVLRDAIEMQGKEQVKTEE